MDSSMSVVVPAVKVTTLSKTFACCKALDSVSLDIRPGEMVALIGASGSGKSTLLRHIAGLARGDEDRGSIEVEGRPMQTLGRLAAGIRRNRAGIGFVFQQFNLVGRLPVMTNVLTGSLARLPPWRSLTGLFPRAEKALAAEALDRVGILDKAWVRASALSGGQQQRAAIARTLVQKARIILADEPIASLDPRNTRIVMDALLRINKHFGITVICNLHSLDLARGYCDRLIGMAAGRVVFDGAPAALTEHIARELYDLEANEVMGTTPVGAPADSTIPALGTAAA